MKQTILQTLLFITLSLASWQNANAIYILMCHNDEYYNNVDYCLHQDIYNALATVDNYISNHSSEDYSYRIIENYGQCGEWWDIESYSIYRTNNKTGVTTFCKNVNITFSTTAECLSNFDTIEFNSESPLFKDIFYDYDSYDLVVLLSKSITYDWISLKHQLLYPTSTFEFDYNPEFFNLNFLEQEFFFYSTYEEQSILFFSHPDGIGVQMPNWSANPYLNVHLLLTDYGTTAKYLGFNSRLDCFSSISISPNLNKLILDCLLTGSVIEEGMEFCTINVDTTGLGEVANNEIYLDKTNANPLIYETTFHFKKGELFYIFYLNEDLGIFSELKPFEHSSSDNEIQKWLLEGLNSSNVSLFEEGYGWFEIPKTGDYHIIIDITNYKMDVSIQLVVGDVDGNGVCTAADITAIYDILLGVNNKYDETADVTGDGVVTAADITAVYSILLEN